MEKHDCSCCYKFRGRGGGPNQLRNNTQLRILLQTSRLLPLTMRKLGMMKGGHHKRTVIYDHGRNLA